MKRKARQNRRPIQCEENALKLLRTVGDGEAFHFYAALGQPTGEKAANLREFLEKTKTVKLESLLFHLQRKDIQTWLQKTIGDLELARKIGRIRVSHDDRVRMKIGAVIESRLKELREENSEFMSVGESPIVSSES